MAPRLNAVWLSIPPESRPQGQGKTAVCSQTARAVSEALSRVVWKSVEVSKSVLISESELACAAVVLRSVPGAGTLFALEFASAKGSAAMQAGVVGGVERSLRVGDRQGIAINLKFADRPRGDLILSRRTQICHFGEPPVSIDSNE